jgi:acetylornithine deacetylase/succinyl-diaminopimelate desuccinylase-like protein
MSTSRLNAVKELCNAVDGQQTELIEYLREFLRIPSVWGQSDELTRAAHYLGGPLIDDGVTVTYPDSGTPDMPNLYAEYGESSSVGLLFNGHMEVYPPSTSWTRDPFGGDVADGRIFGVGVADMKAGTAAMLQAVRIVAATGITLDRNVAALAVPNHFEGGEGTREALRQGLTADTVINCEPSDMKVLLGQRGIAYVKATFRGVAAHTTALDIGVNAIERAARAIPAIAGMDLTDPEGRTLYDQRICNIAMITGGVAHNLVPEICELTIDIRYPPAQDQACVLGDVQRAIERALPRGGPAFDVTLEPTCLRNPRSSLAIPADHWIVNLLSECHRTATGTEPTFSVHRAWPDTPIFWEAGIPAITYGPGSMDCYWDDESVSVNDYLDAIKAYCTAIAKTCID